MRPFAATLLASLVAIPFVAFAYTSPGKPTGFMNDFAHTLTAEQDQALEANLSDFEKRTTDEIAVAIIPSLGDDTIENFAVELFEEWGIGKKDRDNGALLLIAMNDRKMRIEVGYGLEPVLTDAESAHIINDVLRPAFQKSDYYGGITAAVTRMEQIAEGEAQPTQPSAHSSKNGFEFFDWLFLIIPFIVYLGSVLARSKSWWGGGVVGGVAGAVIGLFQGFLYAGVIALALFIPLGLLIDFAVSRSYKNNISQGKRHPWWIGGGGFGGGSGGGGGFGGFGGGSSGGGGSRGGW